MVAADRHAISVLLDALTGKVLVESPDRLPPGVRAKLEATLGRGQETGCARPLRMLPPPQLSSGAREVSGVAWVRIHGLYHDSLIEGPGRRSCALLSGCDRDCPGCWVPHLHAVESGRIVAVDLLADALLDPAHQRDGVSVLGGEPLAQPEGLAALVRALRDRGCPHILVYTGNTYEALRRMVGRVPAIGAVLDEIDMLVDGPFVQSLSEHAGPWTGSGNQRVVDMQATRRADQVVRLNECEPARSA